MGRAGQGHDGENGSLRRKSLSLFPWLIFSVESGIIPILENVNPL